MTLSSGFPNNVSSMNFVKIYKPIIYAHKIVCNTKTVEQHAIEFNF